MKTKIKLFFWFFLAIFSIFSMASAVEFYGDKTTQQIVSSYNWYTLEFAENSSNYLWCIYERYKENGNVKSIKFCEDAVYDIYSTSSYSSALRKGPYTLYSDGSFRLWQKADSNDVFWLRYFNIDGKKQYFRLWIKNIGAKSVKLNSKRWSAVYSTAFMDWLWFALTKKDWDQVRASQVVNNVFTLDWFLLVARTQESYLIDTYTNKMYKYTDPLYPSSRYNKGQVESIFPRIRDNVPSEVSDIQRWPLAEYKMYYNQNEFKSFDLKNTREATEADLNEIRENIKKSLVVFNQDALKLYRDVDWLDLSVGDSSDLPNNTNSNNNKEQTYEESLKEYNSCTSYWNNIKTYTTYDKECYRSLLDSAPLTWAVNHKKLLAPWNAVVNWNGEGELDIDTEDRICLQFKDRKAVYKQKRSKQWEEFQAISKENWLSPSWINIAEKCGKRPERSLLGKIQDFFSFKKDQTKEEQSDYKLLNDYTSLKVACTSLWKGIGYGMNFLGFDLDLRKCENYWKLSFEEYKQKIKTWDWSWNNLNSDSSLYISWWWKILDPFYSWYNSVNFVSANCWGSKYSEFDIFAYLVFFTIVLYFMRYI